MPQKFNQSFENMFVLAVRLARTVEAEAILVLVEERTDWKQLRKRSGKLRVVIAADDEAHFAGAAKAGLDTVLLERDDSPVSEQLTQAVLESIADDILAPGGDVIAVYSGFEPNQVDSISHIRLDEHLGRLTARDLRQLETRVPLDTLKTVVEIAVEIGREGREGQPVGTMFVVGDTKRVLTESHPSGFDPVKGYHRRERNLFDPRVREGIKEIAQLDGAFVISNSGTVEASCRIVDSSAENLTLSKGLGARHWAAAAISRKTNSVTVVISETNGTVRIFQNGEVMLRIEPFRRAMKWKEFEFESPAVTE